MKKAYRLITDNIKLNSEDIVLDVGCGTSTVLKRLNDICHIKGFGIGIEEKMVEQAKLKLPQMYIQKCDCLSYGLVILEEKQSGIFQLIILNKLK